MLGISGQQLAGWQRQGFLPATGEFTFSDLIALRTLQKLRENHVPARRILEALRSLTEKLSHVERPLSELKIVWNGRTIEVQVAGQKMEALTGQLLFDFETAELNNVRAFAAPAAKRSAGEPEREAEHWFQRALVLEEQGAPLGEAIEAYHKAIELNPHAAGALVNLGTVYYHLRRFKEAREYYSRAIAVDPRYPLAHFNLGNLCEECGQVDQAREHYQTALKLDPRYADAHYNLALLSERRGDFLRAARHWQAYLKLDPASQWSAIARRQLDRLRELAVVRRRPESGT